jgi:hypothetical protein
MLSWPPSRSTSDEYWLNIEKTLQAIVNKSNVGPQEAQSLLIEACASTRVRSRYLAISEGPSSKPLPPYMDAYLADQDRENPNTVMVGTKLIDPRRMKLEYRTVDPGEWNRGTVPGGSIDLIAGIFRTGDTQGPIEINAADLRRWRWLGRRPRGPRTGTVARYAEADRKLFPELARLMSERMTSATEAAHVLAADGKIAGSGTADSRARRLAKAYLAKTR